MGNRIFVAVVLLLWASTMSWLVVAKILPPFFSGEPPAHGIIQRRSRSAGRSNVPAAASATRSARRCPVPSRRPKSTAACCWKTSRSREMAPQWMSSIVEDLGLIRLDTRTRLVLDSFGNSVVVRYEGAAQ